MAKTQITDIIEPSVFTQYVIERTAELSAFFRSGIIGTVPEIMAALGAMGKQGGEVNMPFWTDLDGADEVLSDSGSLTAAKITASKDVAIFNMRGRAWSTNDLAHALAGSNPMDAIGDLVAAYWARRIQTALIQMLAGAMGAANMTGNVYDISAGVGDAANLSAVETIKAAGLLGDAQDMLAGMAVHGATYTWLKELDLIDFVPDSIQGGLIPTYLGKTLIVDDTLPLATTVYTSYLFGNGAIGYNEVAPDFATETDRDVLAGDSVLVNRRHFVLHPRGIAWQDDTMAGSSPTNAELATTSNWSRVFEAKNIKIVQFKHKIG